MSESFSSENFVENCLKSSNSEESETLYSYSSTELLGVEFKPYEEKYANVLDAVISSDNILKKPDYFFKRQTVKTLLILPERQSGESKDVIGYTSLFEFRTACFYNNLQKRLVKVFKEKKIAENEAEIIIFNCLADLELPTIMAEWSKDIKLKYVVFIGNLDDSSVETMRKLSFSKSEPDSEKEANFYVLKAEKIAQFNVEKS